MQEGGPGLRKMVDEIIGELCACSVFIKTVVGHIVRNSGNVQDAEDMIQEGLATLAVNLFENKYKGDASIENYAFGICKFKWNNARQKKSRTQTMDQEQWSQHERETEPSHDHNPSEDENMIWTIVGKMSEECKEILKRVYLGLAYDDIGEDLGLARQTVKNKVSSCRKKLKSFLRSHPELKIYFAR